MTTRGISDTRLIGIDLARFLALIGMFAAHILTTTQTPGELEKATFAVIDGRAAALFALLAGVSLTLISGRAQVLAGSRGEVAVKVAVRALLITLIGLGLGQLNTPVAVILVVYGLLFLVAIPFLFLSTKTLAIITATWVGVVSVLAHWLRGHLPAPVFDVTSMSPSFRSFDHIGGLLNGLIFNGAYPALTWSAYTLVGLLVGRLALSQLRTVAGLAVAGAVLVGGAYATSAIAYDGHLPSYSQSNGSLFNGSKEPKMAENANVIVKDQDGNVIDPSQISGTPPTGEDSVSQQPAPPPSAEKSQGWKGELAIVAHTQTLLDLLQTIGFALLTIAGCLLLRRRLGSIARLVAGAGTMTLTIYVLHVLYWHWKMPTIYAHPTQVFWAQVGIAIALGALFAWRNWKGPAEWAVTQVANLAGRAIRSRSES